MNWYRGNLHTHTTRSDGDSPIEFVAEWFVNHGYDFLVQTDHNHFGPTEDVRYESDRPFLIIPGTEISLGSENKPVHLCAVNPRKDPGCTSMPTIIQTLQNGIDMTKAAGGLPIINHPNWNWAFTEYHMERVTGWSLFEIFNASSDCNNFGGGGKLSMEERWDVMLSVGMKVYAVAADDSHQYTGEFWGTRTSTPGEGWVMVQAEELSAEAVCTALEAGRFYSSTEIMLDRYEADETGISLQIHQEDSFMYTIQFVGHGGKVLAERFGTEASYKITGNEGYVRARITSTNGGYCWCQPVFVGS